MLSFLLAVALAADPVVTKGKDSWIEGHVDVAAAPEKVFAVVSDPAELARIDGSTQVSTVPDGECVRVSTHVDHPIASVDYETRSCPDGELAIVQTLVGGGMKEFDAHWRVEHHEGGSRVHYRVRTVPGFYVPQFIVDRSTLKGATRVLARLRDHFASG